VNHYPVQEQFTLLEAKERREGPKKRG